MIKARWVAVGGFAIVHSLAGATSPTHDRAAAAAACYTLPDADARAMCRAKALREPAHCAAIQKPDMRAQCRAEALR